MHSRELRLRVTTDQGHTLFNMEVAAQRLMLSGCSAQFKVIQLRFAKHCCPGQCCSFGSPGPLSELASSSRCVRSVAHSETLT